MSSCIRILHVPGSPAILEHPAYRIAYQSLATKVFRGKTEKEPWSVRILLQNTLFTKFLCILYYIVNM